VKSRPGLWVLPKGPRSCCHNRPPASPDKKEKNALEIAKDTSPRCRRRHRETYVRPWLEDAGDWDEVWTLVCETVNRGNGARLQREVLRRTGRMEDVVDLIVSETERGVV
jgi:hypothetical protein